MKIPKCQNVSKALGAVVQSFRQINAEPIRKCNLQGIHFLLDLWVFLRTAPLGPNHVAAVSAPESKDDVR